MAAMKFWGQEVKPGTTVSCKVGDGLVIHLSQAALGDPRKASENVVVSFKIDDQKIVLGTLSVEKHPQISCDLVFDKDFELSHNSKTASVFFCGYKTPNPVFESGFGEDSSDEDRSDEELETDQIPMQNKESKISAAKVPVKVNDSSSDDDDDLTDSESDSEMSDEDDSSDEVSSGADLSDDSDSEEQTPTPKKDDVLVGKKRAIEAEAPSGKKVKSEQSGDKVSTPHSAKQSSKTPADKSTKTPKSGSHACKSCNKSFGSASALESHQKAKHET